MDSAAIRDLGPWFHNLHLPDGTQTCPDHTLGDFPSFKWAQLAPHLPIDLHGWTALDIGCNAGFYSFELARRGASVTALEPDPHYLRQARWAATQFGLDRAIRFEERSVFEVGDLDSYDLVLFLGVFYHLRYPLLGLDLVARRVRRLLVFQSLLVPGNEGRRPILHDPGLAGKAALGSPQWPKMSFVEARLQEDPTNWWVPDAACAEAMLRSAGMRIESHPAEEMWICAPDSEPAAAAPYLDQCLEALGRRR
jgi:tRNA (mo5U34)-methyltransferase